jgi:hypothetical protein
VSPSLPKGVRRGRTLWLCGLAAASLLVAVVWEPLFHHDREQALQVFSVLLLATWTCLCRQLREEERLSVERTVFILFLAMVSIMALFPQLLQPATDLLPSYRGTSRWRGWTIDPNNTGVILALGLATALRLRQEVPNKFSALALMSWLCPIWRRRSPGWKQRVSVAALVFVLILPLAAPLLRSSDLLVARRAASFSNVMDLSWANRLYVLPGTIQAMLDRPLLGWGWGHVLPIHRRIYAPTFLGDNTAILLNDYAHLGASYGMPLLALVLFLIGWCLLRGENSYAKTTVLALAAAMFFQGVIRIPLTVVPLCLSLGMLLARSPPWEKGNWRRLAAPVVPSLCVLAFLGAWCVAPFWMTDKTIRACADRIVISSNGDSRLTVAFVTEGRLADYGREARAAASLGLRAIIIHPETMAELERGHDTNTWFITQSPGDRHISPDETKATRGLQRGVRAVRKLFDRSGREAPPCPDKPYPMSAVIVTLYGCALALFFRAAWVHAPHPLAVSLVFAAACALWLPALWRGASWPEENRETAEWARQMRQSRLPDDIYREYVVNPEIVPSFSLRHRREVWHTFYQPAAVENPGELLDRVKETIEVQILIRPDARPAIRPFEEIWRTRVCNLAERPYVLAVVLRTLNVPARVEKGKTELWVDGKWLPAAH